MTRAKGRHLRFIIAAALQVLCNVEFAFVLTLAGSPTNVLVVMEKEQWQHEARSRDNACSKIGLWVCGKSIVDPGLRSSVDLP
jgi:hypothetical protein